MTPPPDLPIPVVSVIIPAYNVAEYIGATVKSVLAQTFKDFEIILVNDGSPDTESLEKVIEVDRDRIVYLKQENRGLAGARNSGLRLARGEFVGFLDGDDIWSPEFLAEQVKFIQSNGGLDLVYANAFHFGDGWKGTFMDTSPSTGPVDCEGLLSGRCSVIVSAVLARRRLLFDAGLFDESLRSSEDFDFWIRLVKWPNVKMAYQRKVLAGYRHRSGSLTANTDKFVEGALKVFEKIERRTDLTEVERAALTNNAKKTRAVLMIGRAKPKVLSGEFTTAVELFDRAHAERPNWKLLLMSTWLRLAPRTCQVIYKLSLRWRHPFRRHP